MDPQERASIIASLTDDELKEIRERAGNPPVPEDSTREFIRAVNTNRNRDWKAELAEKLFPAPPQPTRGLHVAREGGDPGRPNITDHQRTTDFIRAAVDPTHEEL